MTKHDLPQPGTAKPRQPGPKRPAEYRFTDWASL